MDTTIESKPEHRRRRRPQRRRKTDRRGSICDGLLGIVVIGSALAIGTVHIPVLLAVSALALIGATLEALALRRVPWPAVVLAALGLFSACQAISLPAAWVSRASPASADVWLRCLVPFSEPALRSFPLSLDAGASVAEALKWLTYASVYIMATRMRARRGSAWLALLLFGSAALVTLITLLHGVADLAVLYGVYHPNFSVGRWSVGPLLNSNNLAGYAILGLFAGGGLLLSDRSPVPRLPLTIGLGVISVALCLSGSRAAVLSALIAGAVTFAWLAKARGSRLSLRGLAVGVAPFVIGIAIAIALGTARDASQLASLDVRRKVSVWLWSLPMIREHALFGVGRGAFESAFSPYREALDYDWSIVVTYAENFVVQWIAEWGVPVGLCAVVVIVGYVLREWHRSRGDRLRFMLLTGLVALLVQNLADLGLEVPALAIAAVLALAAGERPTTAPPTESATLGGLALAVSAPGIAIWVAAIAWSRFPVELERRQMSVGYQELAIKSASERARFRSQLRQAVLRHPGESFFPLLGALVASRAGDGDALALIARSLELGPTNGPVHLVLADLLQAHGATTQAMLHLRLAAQYDRTLAGAVGARAPRWASSIDLLMQAIPDGPNGESVLLDACAKERQLAPKLDCFRRAVLGNPHSSQAQQHLAESLLLAIQARQPPCDTLVERCAVEADVAIQTAERLEPKSWRPGYLMSKVLLVRGDIVGAARLLTRVCPPSVEGDECWHEALMTAIKSGSSDAISTAANAFAARPCDGVESCANMFTLLASNLESGGQPALASTFFTKAAEADPSAARWLKVAEQATQAQLYGVARAALERAERSPDASASTGAHAELLRQRVARATGAPL
jgi:hypothetical protein